VGHKRDFDFPPLDHVAVGEALGVLEFDAAAEVRRWGRWSLMQQRR